MTRERVFAEAAALRTRVYGFHLPWPGIGRIVKRGGGCAWMPERIWWEPSLGG